MESRLERKHEFAWTRVSFGLQSRISDRPDLFPLLIVGTMQTEVNGGKKNKERTKEYMSGTACT
jgi:hypothetical protein